MVRHGKRIAFGGGPQYPLKQFLVMVTPYDEQEPSDLSIWMEFQIEFQIEFSAPKTA